MTELSNYVCYICSESISFIYHKYFWVFYTEESAATNEDYQNVEVQELEG